ncbi:hypothetical protein [Acinetobacter towneri]
MKQMPIASVVNMIVAAITSPRVMIGWYFGFAKSVACKRFAQI